MPGSGRWSLAVHRPEVGVAGDAEDPAPADGAVLDGELVAAVGFDEGDLVVVDADADVVAPGVPGERIQPVMMVIFTVP